MKLHPDDPRLTAYLLGELPADETASIEHAAAADPAIRFALRDLESVQRILTNTLAPATASLLPHQRATILRNARHADQAGTVITLASQRKSWKSWLVPLAAAALVTLATFILINTPTADDGKSVKQPPSRPAKDGDQIPLAIALLPAPGPADASRPTTTTGSASNNTTESAAARDAALAKNGDAFLHAIAARLQQSPPPSAAALPALSLRKSVAAATTPTLPLPMHAGRASLGWITHAIRNEHQLPSPNAVRLEEILNSFHLRLAGSTATAQGVGITTEALPCPWKPTATLMLISIKGAVDTAHDVTATFHAYPAAVTVYRLLGFAPVSGVTSGPLPSRLPAKATITLALEIEPSSAAATTLGSIEWTIDASTATPIEIIRQPAGEPSDDARFAAVLCSYAQWLVHDQPAVIDTTLLRALTSAYTSATIATDRADLLKLIGQALALESKR
jgi:anti-sigma factor RsiW